MGLVIWTPKDLELASQGPQGLVLGGERGVPCSQAPLITCLTGITGNVKRRIATGDSGKRKDMTLFLI